MIELDRHLLLFSIVDSFYHGSGAAKCGADVIAFVTAWFCYGSRALRGFAASDPAPRSVALHQDGAGDIEAGREFVDSAVSVLFEF